MKLHTIISLRKTLLSIVICICGNINAQFNFLIHNGNDTITIPTDKVDSVTFSLTPDMKAQMKLYKTIKVINYESETASKKTIDSLMNVIAQNQNSIQKLKNTNDSLSLKVTTFDQYFTKPTIWLPSIIYGLVGTEVQIFKESLFPMADPDFYNLISPSAPKNVNNHYYSYKVEKSGTNYINIGVSNELVGRILPSSSLVIKNVKPGNSPSTNKNVLVIGDSYTNKLYWVAELQRLITGKVCEYSDDQNSPITSDNISNITFIGTMGSTSTVRHEGYNAIGYSYFATNSYWTIDGNNKLNPFWNTSTRKVDFTDYCARYGYEKIDYCIIMLGRNGNDSWKYVKTVWDALLAHNPEIKVIVTCNYSANPYGAGASGDYLQLTNPAKELQRFEDYCKMDDYKDNFLFVDYHLQFDALNNMPHEASAANQRNDEATFDIGTNGVHPYKEGYWQIADALRPAFHYWFLDSNK